MQKKQEAGMQLKCNFVNKCWLKLTFFLESRLYSEEQEGWSRVGLEQGGSRWAGVDTAWDIELELCSGCELEPCSGFEVEPSPGWDEFSVLSMESLKSRAGVDPSK